MRIILQLLTIVGMIQTKNEMLNYISFILYFATIKRLYGFGDLKAKISDYLAEPDEKYMLYDFFYSNYLLNCK